MPWGYLSNDVGYMRMIMCRVHGILSVEGGGHCGIEYGAIRRMAL